MPIIGLVLFIVVLDQWSKWEIKSSFRLYESKPIIQDFFHFTYVTNDGMAFGLSFPGGKLLLLIMTIVLTFFIVGLLYKEKNGHVIIRYGLAFILGGAIGNLFDRIIYKAVPDFIDFHIENFHWFIFNVSDIFITVGVICMITLELIGKNDKNINQ